MKRISLFIISVILTTGFGWAASRGPESVARTNTQQNPRTQNTSTQRKSVQTVARDTNKSTTRSVSARNSSTTPRAKSANTTRAATSSSARGKGTSTARVATTRITRGAMNKIRARAATETGALTSTFTEGYTECHDAYFACMDQFCGTLNESYRRCICSSKLETVKSRERALGQTASQLQDFKDLNIDVILKTPGEVRAMLSASEGEETLEKTKDKSESAQQLHAITSVLNNTRTKATSTQGRLDAGGDISAIWATTDLTSGADIATLTGESLYNAVHAQCAELISNQCPKKSTLNMVVNAYGMYIENDCSALLTALDKQAASANTSIRQTEREMTTARLDNYNAHNSSSINDCIAMVRKDITADTACGENYVHCLDFTGKYLDRTTGKPIYSADFYKIVGQISLSGDVLENKNNQKVITELNNKRNIAQNSLETCRDIADSVWTEFLHQAITEIYQGQQTRIRQVKDECLDVVNQCYDEQTQSLRDYSKIEDQFLLGPRLELSEDMCRVKLTTCSNLYGGGSDGLQLLLTEMHNITNQKISQKCAVTLQEYAEKLCKVPAKDTVHSYPYGCRMYTPGDGASASSSACLNLTISSITPPNLDTLADVSQIDRTNSVYVYMMCPANRDYTTCNPGYVLTGEVGERRCMQCPGETPADREAMCPGGTSQTIGSCQLDFAGSLYQKMVTYAKEYCTRPSDQDVSISILGDVNTVMDKIRVDMSTVLSEECERQGGKWATHETYDSTKANKAFYRVSNANTAWGWCKISDSSTTSE